MGADDRDELVGVGVECLGLEALGARLLDRHHVPDLALEHFLEALAAVGTGVLRFRISLVGHCVADVPLEVAAADRGASDLQIPTRRGRKPRELTGGVVGEAIAHSQHLEGTGRPCGRRGRLNVRRGATRDHARGHCRHGEEGNLAKRHRFVLSWKCRSYFAAICLRYFSLSQPAMKALPDSSIVQSVRPAFAIVPTMKRTAQSVSSIV